VGSVLSIFWILPSIKTHNLINLFKIESERSILWSD